MLLILHSSHAGEMVIDCKAEAIEAARVRLKIRIPALLRAG